MKNSIKLPYLCITREDLKLMRNLLEPQEIGELLIMLEEYFYEGKRPVLPTKVMKGVWENVIENINRRSEGYKRKVANLKQNKKNKGDFSDFQTLNDIIPQPIQESVSKGQEISEYEELQISSDVVEENIFVKRIWKSTLINSLNSSWETVHKKRQRDY